MKRAVLLLASLLAVLAAGPRLRAQAAPTVPPLWKEREVAYVSAGGLTVRAILLEPADRSRLYPALVLNHGGFDGVTRSFHALCEQWVAEGYVVIAPQFRGEGGSEGQVEFARGEVDDALAALRFLKTLAHVDIERIGMIGYSHGATVTLLAASRSHDLAAAVSVSGVSDVATLLRDSPRAGEIADRGRIRWNPDEPRELRARSVLPDARRILAPLLLLHGEQDNLIPVSQSRMLAAALEKSGRPVTLRTWPDKGHGLHSDSDIFAAAQAFLASHLKPVRLARRAPALPSGRPAQAFPQSRPASQLGPPNPTTRAGSEPPPPSVEEEEEAAGAEAPRTGGAGSAATPPAPGPSAAGPSAAALEALAALPREPYEGIARGGIYQRMSWPDLQRRLDRNLDHPLLAGIDFNVAWAEVNPAEGVYDWSAVDRPLEAWRAAGKRVCINLVTIVPRGSTPYAGRATPEWVFRKGARGIRVEASSRRKETPAATWPVPWDPVYLEEYGRFVRAFAARYDGAPGIDIVTAGIGKLGGLTILDPKIGAEERRILLYEYRRFGFTPERYFRAVERILDTYRAAFTRTPVRLQLSHPFDKTDDSLLLWFPRFAEAAVSRGIGLHYQGITGGENYLRKLERKPVSEIFAASCARVPCGAELVNPIAGTRAENREFMGALAAAVANALGEGKAAPPTGISYLNLYERDVTASNPSSPAFDPSWLTAVENALAGLRLPAPSGTPGKGRAPARVTPSPAAPASGAARPGGGGQEPRSAPR